MVCVMKKGGKKTTHSSRKRKLLNHASWELSPNAPDETPTRGSRDIAMYHSMGPRR